tara:strand:- start:887 stop:1099 length:213 start_codon:yes stop_codon:yes gene_type:complete
MSEEIQVTINGKSQIIEGIITITKLLQILSLNNDSVAIAINGTVIPKTEHESFKILTSSKIEIVHAVGGG